MIHWLFLQDHEQTMVCLETGFLYTCFGHFLGILVIIDLTHDHDLSVLGSLLSLFTDLGV